MRRIARLGEDPAARNAERGKAFAANWGFENAVTNWREVIANKDIDLIDIASPNDTHCEIAIAAGAAHDDDLNLRVDDHQQTSVQGLYAAGDVVRGLNQITVAGGEAAIAATAMHNRLRMEP